MGGHVICAHCGLAGHTRGVCPEVLPRDPFAAPRLILTIEDGRNRVADVPRRCGDCGAPTIITVDNKTLDDRPGLRDLPHKCTVTAAA